MTLRLAACAGVFLLARSAVAQCNADPITWWHSPHVCLQDCEIAVVEPDLPEGTVLEARFYRNGDGGEESVPAHSTGLLRGTIQGKSGVTVRSETPLAAGDWFFRWGANQREHKVIVKERTTEDAGVLRLAPPPQGAGYAYYVNDVPCDDSVATQAKVVTELVVLGNPEGRRLALVVNFVTADGGFRAEDGGYYMLSEDLVFDAWVLPPGSALPDGDGGPRPTVERVRVGGDGRIQNGGLVFAYMEGVADQVAPEDATVVVQGVLPDGRRTNMAVVQAGVEPPRGCLQGVTGAGCSQVDVAWCAGVLLLGRALRRRRQGVTAPAE